VKEGVDGFPDSTVHEMDMDCRPPGARLLLILLYRPEYTHQRGSKSFYAQIGVGRLSAVNNAESVRAILRGGEVAPELREMILSRSSGNPLFMEEPTRTLPEIGFGRDRGLRSVGNDAGGALKVDPTALRRSK
jgi:predicted ATPase